MTKIKFVTVSDVLFYEEELLPQPISNFIPEWFKDIKNYSKNEQAVIVATMSLMGDSRAWVMWDKLRGLREKAELEGRELTEGDANDPIYDYNYFTLNYG